MDAARPVDEAGDGDRRSQGERRRGGERRVAIDTRKRLTQALEPEDDDQVIPHAMWDRRSGQDRRGHPLYRRKAT